MMRIALLLTALALIPASANAQRQINPCDFSQSDSPCEIEGGVYRALIPEGIGPHPAVLYLYGSTGRSRTVTDAAYFRREVVNRGYALLVPAARFTTYPDGSRDTGWGWSGRAPFHDRDDFAFVRRVIQDARRRHNIDPKKVIFAGQSDGGFFIWEIACHRPDMGAAFAVHAGAYGQQLPKSCRRPVKFLQSHGLRDEVVPIKGRKRLGRHALRSDVPGALEMLARTNRCGKGPLDKGRYFGFKRQGWEDCAPGAALDFLTHSGGHGWPRTWMPAVLDWFERTQVRPATAITRRVGDGSSGFKRSTQSGGRFKSVPKN
ncbi:MAG: hypothetical protein AAFR79_05450 [Pseudomonadota bacterium]